MSFFKLKKTHVLFLVLGLFAGLMVGCFSTPKAQAPQCDLLTDQNCEYVFPPDNTPTGDESFWIDIYSYRSLTAFGVAALQDDSYTLKPGDANYNDEGIAHGTTGGTNDNLPDEVWITVEYQYTDKTNSIYDSAITIDAQVSSLIGGTDGGTVPVQKQNDKYGWKFTFQIKQKGTYTIKTQASREKSPGGEVIRDTLPPITYTLLRNIDEYYYEKPEDAFNDNFVITPDQRIFDYAVVNGKDQVGTGAYPDMKPISYNETRREGGKGKVNEVHGYYWRANGSRTNNFSLHFKIKSKNRSFVESNIGYELHGFKNPAIGPPDKDKSTKLVISGKQLPIGTDVALDFDANTDSSCPENQCFASMGKMYLYIDKLEAKDKTGHWVRINKQADSPISTMIYQYEMHGDQTN